MINVEQNGSLLNISFKYCNDYVNRIRTVPGASFNREEKHWEITKSSLKELERIFVGELIYITPRHIILNEKPPPAPDWYNDIPSDTISGLTLPLYSYQDVGANFLAHRIITSNFALLGDKMGVGKSPTSLGATELLMQKGIVDRVLIVTLATLKNQWGRDVVQKFTNDDYVIIKGTKARRKKLYQTANKVPYTIINYDLLLHDLSIINDIGFNLVIFDEIHKLKNHEGKMNEAAVDLNIVNRIGLTGTPVMNRPEELFGVFQVLNKGFLGDFKNFTKNHINNQWTGHFVEQVGYRNLDILREKVGPYLFRRTEAEIEMDLPEITTIYRYMDLSPNQVTIQSEIQSEMNEVCTKLEALKKNKASKSEEIIRLENQVKGSIALLIGCSDSPELFTVSTSMAVRKRYAPLVGKIKNSPKTEELINIVTELEANRDQVIIFTQFERMTHIIKRELENITKCVCYTGQMNEKEREDSYEKFVRGKARVFIATDAASTGLNLQVAQYLVNYDLPWNPMVLDQRIGRIGRVDSNFKKVRVINFVSLDSIDETILVTLNTKRNLVSHLIDNSQAMSTLLLNLNKKGDIA